jgi:hypothetical protein
MIATFAKGSGLVKEGWSAVQTWTSAFEGKADAGRHNDLRPLLILSSHHADLLGQLK